MTLNPSRIKSRLKELGMSYSRFEDLSGISVSTLKRALSGDAVRPSTAAITATTLGTTLEWLCGTDEDEKTAPVVNGPPICASEPVIEPEMSQPALDVHFLISNMTASYDKALATKDAVIRQKNRWIITLAAALGVIVLAVMAWIGIDLAHHEIGWIRG